MVRPLRIVRAGALYHVVNSSQSHSPLFETEADVGRFLSLLGWASREGWLQVLCLAVLTTHFHMIVCACDGRLDYGMKCVEQGYALWFNRTRELSGHVFKGRYFARQILDDVDLAVTADYVDWNPVSAGMVDSPARYPHGSARYYCGDVGMPWLSRNRLEELACRLARSSPYCPGNYVSLWSFAGRAGSRELIARTLQSRGSDLAPITVLLRSGPTHVQEWLIENMRREQGRHQPCLVIPGADLLRRLDAQNGVAAREGRALRAGLLHTVSGWTMIEIGQALGVAPATASRLSLMHRERLTGDAAYLRRVADLVAQAARDLYGALA